MDRRLLVSGLCVALASAGLLGGCASMEQPDSRVYQRLSGETLQDWKSVAEAAKLHWPYAWAALAAYQDSHDPHRKPLQTSADCPEPHVFLRSQGWELWDRLPLLSQQEDEIPPEMRPVAQAMRDAHLRAEVWAHRGRGEVVVAFGGTAVSSLEDWKSNAHWLLQPLGIRDAYDVLSDSFIPAFKQEYLRRSALAGGGWLKNARVIPVGHSLGGGLAQRLAYSLWYEKALPAAKEVYAFNPSPVSGKRSTADYGRQPKAEQPYKGLVIYRVYNRGEILASLRSVLQLGNPNKQYEGQTWVDLRYRDNWSWRVLLPSGSVHAHGMQDLACFMKRHLPASALAPAAIADKKTAP